MTVLRKVYNHKEFNINAEFENIYRLLSIVKSEATQNAVSEVTVDLSGYVAKSLFSGKGSILAATGASSPASLPIGTDGQVIVADSSQTQGMKYANLPAKGNTSEIQFNSSGDMAGDSNLVWDNTNKRIGVGVTPAEDIHADGTIRSDTGFSVGTMAGVGSGTTLNVYNDGTSGQLSSITIKNGIVIGLGYIP